MSEGLRLDKWLWFARFFKTRGLAQKAIEAGEVLVNDRAVTKASQPVKVGDRVACPAGRRQRRVTVAALGTRRGPASEAQALYGDEDFVDPPL